MASPCADNLVVASSKGVLKEFKQFREDVAATVTRLKAQQLRSIVLVAEDTYFYCVGFMAALHAACRIVIPPSNRIGMVEYFVSEGCPLLADIPLPTRCRQIEIGGVMASEVEFEALSPEASLLDFYTSGSTGAPKKVSKFLSQIEDELVVLQQKWGETLQSCWTLGTVTHQHIYGLYFKALWPLCAGRPIIAEQFYIWEELLAAAPPGSCFVSSPAHLSRIPPLTPLTAEMMPQMILSAGEHLSTQSASSAAKVFGRFPMEIYGSTETGAIAYRQQTPAPTPPFTPLKGMKIRASVDGLLSVQSKYTDGEDWCATNDIAKIYPNGSFMLTGRANQFVKIAGKRVSLAEVEKYLNQSDLVLEAAVLMLEDQRESLAAVVELTEKGWLQHTKVGPFRLNRRLRHYLHNYLGSAAIPRRWRFVRKLPLNSQGKRIQKAAHDLFEHR